MKQKAAALAVTFVMLITLTVSALFVLVSQPQEAQAAPAVSCQVTSGKNTARVLCQAAGVVVLDTRLNLPIVTLPPIKLPGSTETVTMTMSPEPQATVTQTQTMTAEPQTKTMTMTVSPENSASPTGPTDDRSRQVETEYVTVGPPPVEPEDNGILPETIIGKTVVGVLSLIVIVIIILLGMYGGYYIGYKDSDAENTTFLRALSDKISSRQ